MLENFLFNHDNTFIQMMNYHSTIKLFNFLNPCEAFKNIQKITDFAINYHFPLEFI